MDVVDAGLGAQGLGAHGLGAHGLGAHGLGAHGLGAHGFGDDDLVGLAPNNFIRHLRRKTGKL